MIRFQSVVQAAKVPKGLMPAEMAVRTTDLMVKAVSETIHSAWILKDHQQIQEE